MGEDSSLADPGGAILWRKLAGCRPRRLRRRATLDRRGSPSAAPTEADAGIAAPKAAAQGQEPYKIAALRICAHSLCRGPPAESAASRLGSRPAGRRTRGGGSPRATAVFTRELVSNRGARQPSARMIRSQFFAQRVVGRSPRGLQRRRCAMRPQIEPYDHQPGGGKVYGGSHFLPKTSGAGRERRAMDDRFSRGRCDASDRIFESVAWQSAGMRGRRQRSSTWASVSRGLLRLFDRRLRAQWPRSGRTRRPERHGRRPRPGLPIRSDTIQCDRQSLGRLPKSSAERRWQGFNIKSVASR